MAVYAILAIPFLPIFLLTGIAIFLSAPALLGAMGGVALLMLIGWVGTKIGGWLLFHDDPEYRQWIKSDEHLEAASKVMDQLLTKNRLDHGEETYLDALSDLIPTH